MDTDEISDTKSAPINFNLRYGQFPLLKIWKNLGLENEFKKIQKDTDAKYSLNSAAFLMTFMTALLPDEVELEELNSRTDGLLGGPQMNVELSDLTDCFKRLSDYKDVFLAAINKRLNAEFGKERTERIYYDVFSDGGAVLIPAFVEKLAESKRKNLPEYMKDLARKNQANGALPKDCIDAEGNVVVEKLPDWFYIQSPTDEAYQNIDKWGSSDIGFAFDSNGIPLDFEVLLENGSDLEKQKTFAEKLKKKYKAKQVVRVINPVWKIKPNLLQFVKVGLGFLVNQKIAKLPPEEISWVHNKEGYHFVNPQRPDEGKYKVLKDWERPEEKGQDPVTCNLVGIFNTQGKRLYLEILKLKEETEKDPTRKAKLAQIFRAATAPKLKKSGEPVAQRPDKWNVSDFRAIAFNFGSLSRARSQLDSADSLEADAIQAVRMYRAMNQMRSYYQNRMENFYTSWSGTRTYQDLQAETLLYMFSLLLLRMVQIKTQQKNGFAISIKELVEVLNGATIGVWGFDDNKKPFFLFLDTYTNTPSGMSLLSRDLVGLLMKAGIGNTPRLSEVMESVEIPLQGSVQDIKELAAILGTKFRTIRDVIPKPYFHEK